MNDLNSAYRFRQNCERSDLILQSFVDSTIDETNSSIHERITDENDEQSVVIKSNAGSLYEYWPPVGLNVKRVPTENKKILTNATNEILSNQTEKERTIAKTETLEYLEFEQLDETSDQDEQYEQESITDDGEERQTVKIMKKIDADDPDYSPAQIQDASIKVVRGNKARLGQAISTKRNAKITPKKSTESVLSKRKSTSAEKKQPKTCQICGNTYKYQHALDSHMRRHRNEKPFVCSVCGKGFVINFELTRHMRTVSSRYLTLVKYF